MQTEYQAKENPTYDLARQPITFYRPKEYSDRLLKNHLLFLLLPSTVILLVLPFVFRAPILLLVAVFTLPLLGLITFITYKTVTGTYLTLSAEGLEFHEAVYNYDCRWLNLEALQEVRVGFTKVRGVQLRNPASMQTKSWYENLETIGTILSIFTGSSSPSNGSTYAKGGKFMPVGLFVPGERTYDTPPWQIIRQQAPWLFDPTLRAARLKEMEGTNGVFKLDLKKILASRASEAADQ